MHFFRRAVRDIRDWHFKFAALLSAVCLPISVLAEGWRYALVVAALLAPALFLIWWGDKLSTTDAGRLLTSPLYKEIVGAALMFIGWMMLAHFVGTLAIAPLF